MIEIVKIPALLNDEPIFPEEYSVEGIDAIRKDQGEFIFSTQYMLDPISPEDCIFKKDWIQHWLELPENLIYYIFVDPANSQKKRSDYTAMIVVGVGYTAQGVQGDVESYYIVDMIRDRINVFDRVKKLFGLIDKYKPYMVCYEQAGMNSDHNLIEEMRKDHDHKFSFNVVKVGRTAKFDRIVALQPVFQNKRIYLPFAHNYVSKYLGRSVNLTEALKTELLTFSKRTCEVKSRHVDMIDAMSQMCLSDVFIKKPEIKEVQPDKSGTWDELRAVKKKMRFLRGIRGNEKVSSQKLYGFALREVR